LVGVRERLQKAQQRCGIEARDFPQTADFHALDRMELGRTDGMAIDHVQRCGAQRFAQQRQRRVGRGTVTGAARRVHEAACREAAQIGVAPGLVVQGRQAELEKSLHGLLAQRRERIRVARLPLRRERAQRRRLRQGGQWCCRAHATWASTTQS
jgi:hypothetical protein